MAKRNRSMTEAGHAQQVVESGNTDRFQRTAELANSVPAVENAPAKEEEKPQVKRPMSSRKTAQVTCTMDQEDRDFLKRLAIKLSAQTGEIVTLSGALRYLIDKARSWDF